MGNYDSTPIAKSDRIKRLVDHLYAKMPEIEAARAELITESFKATEGQPVVMRKARSFEHILKNLPIIIRPEELIVGSTTIAPRGCQTYPEFSYEWLEAEFETVETRSADPFYISDETKKRLLAADAYWKGKTTSELATSYMAPETLRAMKHNFFTPGNYFYNGVGHVTVQYETVLAIGLNGVKEKVRKEMENCHFGDADYSTKMCFLESILISCGARLAPFDIQELRDLTMYDELQLDTLGDKKTALFLIMSDTDSTFNFLISMVYTQLFNLLCDKADDVYGGKLPIHVRCLIDECANIGQIPKLEKLVATIRSREISACLVLQAQSQLKAIYKDNADTIIGNMDTSIFLGGKEPTTLKELAAVLGKETIDTYNTGESRGRETSHSLNYQKLGKELMSQDELAVMDGGKCILQLRGVRPFLSDKYDITQHPNYKYTADADPKNAFSIEDFLRARLKLKPNQVCDVYEIDAAADD